MFRPAVLFLAAAMLACALQPPPRPPSDSHLTDAFSTGWMLRDTNGDGIVDFIAGKIVVPSKPSAAENAAAANVAARLGFGTTGLTPPLVVSSEQSAGDGPRIWIGERAVPNALAAKATQLLVGLQLDEGGVFWLGDGLVILGKNDAGLTAAANAFSARAPYVWKVPGPQLGTIVQELDKLVPNAAARVSGIVYSKGRLGVSRVLLKANPGVTVAGLKTVLALPTLATLHGLVITGGASVATPKPLATAPLTPVPAGAAPADDANTPQPLDLALLYTSKGLFKGTPKMPIPSSLDAQLSVPAGAAGIAMANVAARMGLESTGLALPLAKADADQLEKDIHTKALISATSTVGQAIARKLQAENTSGEAVPTLAAGEGELRVVDRAFGKQSAVLVRGDEPGATAALQILSDRLPNLWEPGKRFASLEEVRYDLHRFFSLRSSAGQAAAALYHLKQWTNEINRQGGGTQGVKAEIYTDIADAGLNQFAQRQLETALEGAKVEVKTASLHAGTQCCSENPQLHYEQPGIEFHQGTPAFTQDILIPWEGARLVRLVQDALHDIQSSRAVKLAARVSEGPEVRQKLRAQLTSLIAQHGVAPDQIDVQVLCAYKQGYSWLMDDVMPKLRGKGASRIKIEFAKDTDPTGLRLMYSPARWVQELYPVDEMLAKELGLPLTAFELSQFDSQPGAPTYRVHAFDGAGKELYSSGFEVKTVMRPYNGVIPRYEQVQVETGWVKLEAGPSVVLDQRIETDLETFWDKYQNETLPRIYEFILSQAKGNIRPEFAPPFDTLRLDIHMSEPDYAISLDKERISTLEAIQEDTFYSTENFINMLTNLESGRPETYAGRIIPVVHGSEDGKDGRVHIEFYGKPAANPLVRLSWTDQRGERHEKQRDLAVLSGAMQPRLAGVRVKAQEPSLEQLTWLLDADYLKDDYEEWIKLQPEEQTERSVFPVEQAKGQIEQLAAMHQAGLYQDEIAYAHLRRLAVEFELPLQRTAKAESPAPRAYAAWNVSAPVTPRPQITQQVGSAKPTSPIVQWDEPISPDENTEILKQLAQFDGVSVYWMGRSYLGRDIWAADVTLPTPAQLRSSAKETTLKASILYSGRQHANEVSSTSHVNKLGEQLVTDAATRAMLKQVNVILHPIDNPDGAQLSIALAKITPDNLLHPGYHGSLAADVAVGQADSDPLYPESRTRRQLLDAWLPDGFLNPHGYPSHEWVQPFSEYTGWVQSREAANPGRAWWIPRGWFTSLSYIRDADHPYSEKVTYELRDRIVEAERNVPGLLELEQRMNGRYERFGQRWQPKDMTQPLVDNIRIYMSLKGSPARSAAEAARGGSATGGVSPDITWDSGYTEAPDETAHGDYLKLMASAGLAFDRVHLSYFANGKLRIRRTEKEAGDKVTWQIQRDRPNLPAVDLPAPSEAKSEAAASKE